MIPKAIILLCIIIAIIIILVVLGIIDLPTLSFGGAIPDASSGPPCCP